MKTCNYISLYQSQEGICWICGYKIDNLASISRDHIIPVSMGGKNNQENYMPAHAKCNSMRSSNSIIKAAKQMKQMREQLGEQKFFKLINGSKSNSAERISGKSFTKFRQWWRDTVRCIPFAWVEPDWRGRTIVEMYNSQ